MTLRHQHWHAPKLSLLGIITHCARAGWLGQGRWRTGCAYKPCRLQAADSNSKTLWTAYYAALRAGHGFA